MKNFNVLLTGIPIAVVEEVETPNEITTDKEKIYQELLETFTPELAHSAYIPFCKLAGG